MPTDSGPRIPTKRENRHKFAAVSAFDETMQKLVQVPKSELERRLQAERETKDAKQ